MWNTTSATGGDWGTAAYWVGAKLPGARDEAVVNLPSSGTVRLNNRDFESVNSPTTNATTPIDAGRQGVRKPWR
jgi:hypothetical protein